MKQNRPVIGLSSSYEKNERFDRINLNHSYLDAIRQFGGIPLVLPVEGEPEELETLVGFCDGILLTGGLMRYEDILEGVRQRCGWIAPISVYPGECEQEAMADAVLEVLRGKRQASRYTGSPVFQGFGWEK